MSEREFDLILFGATGFVGRLTAAHLAHHAPDHLRIAIAGRSQDRLEAARAELPPSAANWPAVVVDASDEEALRAMARSTRVVVSTVGPYARYGMPLVGACAEAGTHYCDLTGEVLFVREAIDRHHETAVASGARLVNSCGFDSVPSDLGVLVTAQRAAEDGEGTLGETTLHVRSLRGGLSGGTIDSMREQIRQMSQDAQSRRTVGDPYGLSPDRNAEPAGSATPKGEKPRTRLDGLLRKLPFRQDAQTGRWTAPFVMAGYNTRVVRRSNALTGWSYGREFRYHEVSDTGQGATGAVRAAVTATALGGLAAGMWFTPTRFLLDRVLPKPGSGPGQNSMDTGRFVLDIETTTTTGARYRTRVAADYDPGYSGTAIMLGQSALALAEDEGRLPQRAGVLTPATALGEVLVERLRGHGFTFQVERVKN